MKYILLYLVLASDELLDLEPPTMKCKPKQQVSSSDDDDDDDDDDDISYSSKRKKGNNDEIFCVFIFLSIIIHNFTQFS